MRLYRTMLVDESDGLPVVGSERSMLGVRVPIDIEPDAAGVVHPGRRGMSVTADDPFDIPARALPRRHGGLNDNGDIFEIDAFSFAPPLDLVPERPPHHVVAPSESMPFGSYGAALGTTRKSWSLIR